MTNELSIGAIVRLKQNSKSIGRVIFIHKEWAAIDHPSGGAFSVWRLDSIELIPPCPTCGHLSFA